MSTSAQGSIRSRKSIFMRLLPEVIVGLSILVVASACSSSNVQQSRARLTTDDTTGSIGTQHHTAAGPAPQLSRPQTTTVQTGTVSYRPTYARYTYAQRCDMARLVAHNTYRRDAGGIAMYRPAATASEYTGSIARPSTGAVTYVIQPYDTLYSIARRYRVSVAALARLNNLDSYSTIRSVDLLIVPRT